MLECRRQYAQWERMDQGETHRVIRDINALVVKCYACFIISMHSNETRRIFLKSIYEKLAKIYFNSTLSVY